MWSFSKNNKENHHHHTQEEKNIKKYVEITEAEREQ
jgi:hypothetical protein